MASKPEDLGSCNSIFTLLLLASFFLTMFGENSGSRSIVSNAAWMNYVPFTAVMSTPARALLGQVPLYTALISLLLTLAVALKGIIREEISKGKYLIMSSHQMPTVEEFCTDITILDRSRTVLQGNLNDIKKGYGRVNLKLKTDRDVADVVRASGAMILTEKENEYQIKVKGEEQAMALLRELTERKVTVVTFDLQEPSLHEIFVEKVGAGDETA